MNRLQGFGLGESQYERPTQAWRCGRSVSGRPCDGGPDRKGRCTVSFACIPVRKGDRWHCTRSGSEGGKCQQGPFPDGRCAVAMQQCTPRRNLRALRGVAVHLTVLLSAGILLIWWFGPGRLSALSPGDLSSRHGTGMMACEDCHSAASDSSFSLLGRALVPSPLRQESRLCMNCHDMGADGLRPHAMPSARIAALTQDAARAPQGKGEPFLFSLMSLGLVEPPGNEGQVACVRCHTEHHGSDADLTTILDVQCQGCHSKRFNNFSENHPEFTSYALQRRTRLIFDHRSHNGKHFDESDRKFACESCHAADSQGVTMRSPDFDTGCGGCHAEAIQGKGRAGEPGVMVFSIPGLDLEALAAHGAAIGEWPEYADGELTPLMRLWLSADPDFTESAALLENLDLLDLSNADQERIRAVETLAWSVKRLLSDLLVNGQTALKTRLESALGEKLSEPQFAAVAGLLPSEVIKGAQETWFPDLGVELADYGKGVVVPTVSPGAAGTPDSERAAVPAADSGDDDILGNAQSILDGDDSGDDILGDQGDILGAEGDLAPEQLDILGGEDLPDVEGQTESEGEDGADEAVGAAGWVGAGGWYRQYSGIYYRPAGHEDPFLQAWLELTRLGVKAHSPAASSVFALLSDPKGVGFCGKCHSVDNEGPEIKRINWRSRPTVPEHPLTLFVHQAHFSLAGDKGCLRCHDWKPDQGVDFMVGYESGDPYSGAGNFAGVKKETCVVCHNSSGASEACGTCHRYHAAGSLPVVVQTPDG